MTPARPRVVVTCRAFPETLRRLAGIASVDVNADETPLAPAELLRRARAAQAILAFMPDSVDAAFLRECPALRVIACALKGADNFDTDACAQAGVWVSIVPDLLTAPTAELAVGLAIGLARRIRDGDAIVRGGTFDGWRPILYGAGLDGATVAVVGMGRLGRAVAQRLSGFGCRLIGVDPHQLMPAEVAAAALDVALRQSDFVILCAPLTGTTKHMIDAAALAVTKPGALLVNVGRGSVVDEAAVLTALESGRLGGYAADVFELEDWALPGRPREIAPALRTHARTLFTPHLGSAVEQVRRAIELRAAENIIDVLEGRRPRDAINEPRQPARRAAG